MSTLRRRVRTVSLVILLVASAAWSPAHGTLAQAFETAVEKAGAGDHAGAVAGFDLIIATDPKIAEVWLYRAVAKWNLHDLSGAQADAAQALRLAPDWADAYRIRGLVRREAGEIAGAVEDLDQALARVDGDAELHGVRGESYFRLGQLDAALADLNRVLEIDPDSVAALYLRGQIQEQQGVAVAAEADYTRVVELDPQHADAWNHRGWLRFRRLDLSSALADAQHVLMIAPTASVGLRLAGYAQFGLGDYEAAARSLALAADHHPEDGAYALFVRHYALLRLGRGDERVAAIFQTTEASPWVQALARYISGRLSEEQLEAMAAEPPEEKERRGRGCEANFYLALQRLHEGDHAAARLRLQAARALQVTSFVEDTLAAVELQRLPPAVPSAESER
jgi:tetratricopeptide (TPR) repeat protein